MQKEKIITIVVGLLIGVAAAGFFFLSTKLRENPNKTKIEAPKDTTDSKILKGNFSLILPEDGFIATSSALKVTGTGQSGAVVIIITNTQELKAIVGDDQKFEIAIKLEDGENRIQAISIVPSLEPQVINRTVTLTL